VERELEILAILKYGGAWVERFKRSKIKINWRN
jgi:hypothetical protein